MLDLCSALISVSCVLFWFSTSVIHRRLQQANEPARARLVFNEPRLLRRYLELAATNSWSRVPVIIAYSSLAIGLTVVAVYVVLLTAHSPK